MAELRHRLPAQRRPLRAAAIYLPGSSPAPAEPGSRAVRLILLVVGLVLLFLSAWTFFAKIERLAIAPGLLASAEPPLALSHPDGGRLARVAVEAGQEVAAGALLLELDNPRLAREAASLEGNLATASLQAARLEAEVAERDFTPPEELLRTWPELAALEARLFEARRALRQARLAAAQQERAERQREAEALSRHIAELEHGLALIGEQLALPAAPEGAARTLERLALQRAESEQRAAIEAAAAARETARARAAQAEAAAALLRHESSAALLAELRLALRERERLGAALAEAQRRLRALKITAPQPGVVESLMLREVGLTAAPGAPLVTLLPARAGIIVEARFPPEWSEELSLGQEATVRPVRVEEGGRRRLAAQIVRIGPRLLTEPQTGGSYLPVELALEPAAAAPRLSLPFGQAVEVEVRLGERRILSLLLDPLQATIRSALTE